MSNLLKNLEYRIMLRVTEKRLRDTIANVIASNRGKNLSFAENTKSSFIEKGKLSKHVDNLRSDGFTVFDHLVSSERLSRIMAYIEMLECHDPYRPHLGSIDLTNPAPESHIAHYERKDLVRNSDILEIANDNGVIALAQEFLGAAPTISNINMWWSFGGKKQAEEAQLYHRDVDDWRFCKFFIYLTDVSAENGPHIYVKGSSASPAYRRIRRYKDNEIESKFGKQNIIIFERPKGSAFMVDTFGFHKGLLPKSGRRLLLQVEYSLDPLAVEKYSPVPIDNNIYDKYVNRLIISD